jgi:hypothetical protein
LSGDGHIVIVGSRNRDGRRRPLTSDPAQLSLAELREITESANLPSLLMVIYRVPAVHIPNDEQTSRMLGVCVGESVDSSYWTQAANSGLEDHQLLGDGLIEHSAVAALA